MRSITSSLFFDLRSIASDMAALESGTVRLNVKACLRWHLLRPQELRKAASCQGDTGIDGCFCSCLGSSILLFAEPEAQEPQGIRLNPRSTDMAPEKRKHHAS